MSLYIRGCNPIWLFVDLVGQILDDTYYISFLENTVPYMPQSIFQDPDGTIPWANPLEFYPNGTLPDNMYFNEDLVYRLEIRKGPLQSDPLIYVINNYMVGTGGGMTPTNLDILTADNQISNPQFSVVNFVTPPGGSSPQVTFSTAGTYNIAPGWQLVLVGTGTCTVTQLILSGSQNFIDNPPYALQVTSSTFSSCQLIQTLKMNGAIWSLGAVGMSVLINAVVNSAMVTLIYQPSTGPGTQIASGIIPTTGFAPFGGFTNLNNPSPNIYSPGNPSTNTDLSTVAYVQIIINLPGSGEVQISNIQLMGQDDPLPDPLPFPSATIPEYQQQTNERELDHLAHYYDPQLAYKPIPSYLVGWDFPLNPAQFGSTVGPITAGFANNSFYALDQTIVFQSTDASVTASQISDGSLRLTAGATTQMAIIQYLPQAQARKILNDFIAVNISAKSQVNSGSGIVATVSLWYTKGSLPSTIGSSLSLISTLGTNGKPTAFNGTWFEVKRQNLQDATFTIGATVSSNPNYPDFNFNGWNLNLTTPSDIDLATYFAIVIGTASVANTYTINFNSIGLMSGMIATRPAPKTQDEVLRECQYYYEMSYPLGNVPGIAVTTSGMVCLTNPLSSNSGPLLDLYKCSFGFLFKTIKNAIPTTLTFYSPDSATPGTIQLAVWNGTAYNTPSTGTNPSDVSSTQWNQIGLSTYGVKLQPANSTKVIEFSGVTQGSEQGEINFHYVSDSRLGQ
jgi:hypothetical protein